ncbi:MAG: hypothetical protein AAF690_27380 [Acidobacteriota bacterium]
MPSPKHNSTPSFGRAGGRLGQRRTHLLQAAVLAVTLWILGAIGFLDGLRGPLEDGGTRLRTQILSDDTTVLLVPELRTSTASEEQAIAAVEQLAQLGATGLGLSSWPADWSDATAGRILDLFPQAVFGRRPVSDGVHPDNLSAPSVPSTVAAHSAWSLPPAARADARSRRQLSRLVVDDQELRTLAAEVTKTTGSESYGIVYRGAPGTLPLMSLERVAQGELTQSLVKSRVALIDPSPPSLGYRTPAGREPMSLLEIQGHAVDTLRRGARLEPLPGWIELFLLLVLSLCLTALTQRIRVRWLVGTALFTAGLGLTAALLLQIFTGYLAPGVETALLGAALCFTAARQRLGETQESARALLKDSMGRLQNRVWPSSFYLSEDPWPHLADLVDQTFDLRRLIFLEIVPGDHRVREIHAVGCALGDIHERRRDILRTPYSTAIRQSAPLRLERTYLRDPADGEVQYLVPLSFGGDVLGFWAFGAFQETTQARDFDLLLHNFADQLGEVLHHRSRTQHTVGSLTPLRGRALWERQDETFRALHWLSVLLERRLTRLEGLLQGLGSAVAVYDLFGRAIDVTQRMGELLHPLGLNAKELSSLQLISKLTHLDAGASRDRLRRVLLAGETISLEVEAAGEDLDLALTLTPVRPQATGPLDEATTFGIIGVALELRDNTMQSALSRVQGDLSERLGVRLRNDLAAVDFALQLLDDKALGAMYADEMIAVAALKTGHMQKVIDECEDFLSLDPQRLGESHYPIDPQPHLQRALDRHRPQAEERRIELAPAVPRVTSHVLASPLAFEKGVQSMLGYLLEDARDGSRIDLQVEEGDTQTHLRLAGEGYGTPQRTLDSILEGDTSPERSSHRDLARLSTVARSWGGSLEGESQIGEGTRLTLSLERLHYL